MACHFKFNGQEFPSLSAIKAFIQQDMVDYVDYIPTPKQLSTQAANMEKYVEVERQLRDIQDSVISNRSVAEVLSTIQGNYPILEVIKSRLNDFPELASNRVLVVPDSK